MDNTTTGTTGEWIVQPGTDVYGSDDRKVGSVDDIQGEYLVVHKGFFFPKDHYIPFSAIAGHTDDRIDLNVTADEATSRDWDQAPAESGSYATTSYDDTVVPGSTVDVAATGTYATDTVANDAYVADDAYATSATSTTTGSEEAAPFDHRTAGSTPHADDAGDIRVPVVQEELTATKTAVERGAVRVETVASEREQTLEVPVTEERVHVERRTVDRPAEAGDYTSQSGTIEVPVYGEEVATQKRARVVEEVEISKDAVQETRTVSDTVHREDVNVIDETIDATTGTTGTTRRTDR